MVFSFMITLHCIIGSSFGPYTSFKFKLQFSYMKSPGEGKSILQTVEDICEKGGLMYVQFVHNKVKTTKLQFVVSRVGKLL